MIIPVRCFTCGKVLADKYEYYKKKVDEMEREQKQDAKDDSKHSTTFDGVKTGKVMDDLGLTRMCCRRHMLGHVDLVEII